MSQVAVIGRREEALCFLAAGFVTYEAANSAEADVAVERAEKDGCDIIFITPEFSDTILRMEEKYGEKLVPAVIPLPLKDPTETGKNILKGYVEKAVGADIIFRDAE